MRYFGTFNHKRINILLMLILPVFCVFRCDSDDSDNPPGSVVFAPPVRGTYKIIDYLIKYF